MAFMREVHIACKSRQGRWCQLIISSIKSVLFVAMRIFCFVILLILSVIFVYIFVVV